MDKFLTSSRLMTVFLVALGIATLYIAKGILLPFALAVLLAFVLSPAVRRLERWHLPRILAVILVVGLVGMFVAGTGYVMYQQFAEFSANLPDYTENLRTKLQSLSGRTDGAFDRIRKTLSVLGRELESAAEPVQRAASASATTHAGDSPSTRPPERPSEATPVPVKLIESPPSILAIVGDWVGSFVELMGTAGIVVVLVAFMLVKREDLRNRLIALVGLGQLRLTTQAMDEATERVSRYLRMQVLINASFGAVVAVGLLIIGLPNAILWGVLAGILRFVPYAGPIAAALMPITLALAVADGWTLVILVAGFFVILELVTNNLFEPWLYGSSTGVSSVGIVASAFFWAWLWGALGLILSTPLTVCLTVLGRYVPQLRFINLLFSDQPALSIDARLYQRLLAVDHDEAQQLIDEFLKDQRIDELCDTALIPLLAQVERDHRSGALDDERREIILDFVRETLDDLPRQEESESDGEPVHQPDGTEGSTPREVRLLCLPARTSGDALAAEMFARRAARSFTSVSTATVNQLASEILDRIATDQIAVAFIASVAPYSELQARYLTKRLRRRPGHEKVLIGLWHVPGDMERATARLIASGADQVAQTFCEALTQADRLAALCRAAPKTAEIAQGG